MGLYIDRGNKQFQDILRSDFVDKTGVINLLNRSIDTENRFVCVSRPRRFGKTIAANMIYTYYDRTSNAKELFDNFEIAKSKDYETFLNKYPTIYIDLNYFSYIDRNIVVREFQKIVIADLKQLYPNLTETEYLMPAFAEINKHTGDRFVLLIDEWDSWIRDVDKQVQEEYLNFLRSLFKSNNAKDIFALVYMTGILPIIKYETQSALNNFREYSVLEPGQTAKYYGFTKDEVKTLCKKNGMIFSLMEHAYDGYIIGTERSMFNPTSVMLSILYGDYKNRWGKSASYATIERYIKIDTLNVRKRIVKMLEGKSVYVQIASFRNDMKHIVNCDDVLTLLAHLGYLSYDPETSQVNIPNTEVSEEFKNSLRNCGWGGLSKALGQSYDLLMATIEGDKQFVAEAMEEYHREATSFIEYNDENSLACAIMIAYYSAKSYYEIFREFPTGKGYADMVFLPLPNTQFPAIVVELKYDKTAYGAIAQIKDKKYPERLKKFSKQIVLAGINYDKVSKAHEVEIETVDGEGM
ncbi:MAG: AAA family ATPase [Bacteroidales bacterium]|nr:AAA family ATPase [Bacteroidales bacterium]